MRFEAPVEVREFADWGMGFQALHGSERFEFPELDGQPKNLRAMVEDYGRSRDFLLLLRQRGLDPHKELPTAA